MAKIFKPDPVLEILYTQSYPSSKLKFVDKDTLMTSEHAGIQGYDSPRQVRSYATQSAWLLLPKNARLAALEKYGKRYKDVPGARLYDVLEHRQGYDHTYVWLDVEHNIALCSPVLAIVDVKIENNG